MQYHFDMDGLLNIDHIFVNRCLVEKATDFHAHNFIEIAYVAQGQGSHIIGDRTLPASSGDITVLNYDIPHAFVPNEQPLLVYNCIFTPVFLDRMLSDSRSFLDVSNHFLLGDFYQNSADQTITVRAVGNENLHIQNIYQKMLTELEEKRIGYREIVRSYLIDMLITVFRLNSQQKDEQYRSLSDAIDYISLNFKQPIAIKELAEIACFSQTTFCRKFKEATSMTVTDFIQSLRIEEACKLLVTTEHTVEEIANQVGYRDMKHFYAVFKKITGRLPKDYRRISSR